jgi:hypothetical protein
VEWSAPLWWGRSISAKRVLRSISRTINCCIGYRREL